MPERIFRGAALLTALTAYAETLEAKVTDAFLGSVATMLSVGDLSAIIDELQQGKITADDLPPRIAQLEMASGDIGLLVSQAVRGGGTVTAKKAQLEMDWDVTQPDVLEAARNLTATTITDINNTTRKAISDLIYEAIDTGMGRDELVRKIKLSVGLLPSHVGALNRYEQTLQAQQKPQRQITKLTKAYQERLLNYRAKMIGRTEVSLALNVGQEEFWKQMQKKGMLPQDAQRQWMTADDERTCDICGPMDGELAPIGGVWLTNVNQYVQVPSDTHPNCRCAMGLVFPNWPGLQKLAKFNPYHDEQGRFTTAGNAFTIGAMPASMRGTPSHVAALASAKEGFTYDQKRGEFRKSGFAVSPFPEHETTFGLDEWARSGPELVKKYMADKADVLAQPNSHVGGWKSEDRQGRVRIFLDVSVVRRDQDSAANLARRHAQISYFDLGRGYEMRQKKDGRYYSYSYTAGDFVDPDEIGKASTRQGGVYFIAPRDARDPQALLTFVNAISDSQPVLMGSALSKFNPYHDELGRFTSANAGATISGGALGANREAIISLAEAALGPLTDSKKTLLRDAPAGAIDFVGIGAFGGKSGVSGHPGISMDARVAINTDARGKLKEKGAQTVADEMGPHELVACAEAQRLLQRGIDVDPNKGLARDFVAEQHNMWAETAGDHRPEALAVQVAAAEMQGWDDQKIADRVFRETSREEVADARDLASRVIANTEDSGALLYEHFTIDSINEIGQAEGIGTAKTSYGRGASHVKANVMVAAQSFIRSQLLGDAHKAVLAANQRVAQRDLKAAVGDAPTITLFRGVKMAMQPGGSNPGLLGDVTSVPTGGTIRSQSSPLSSWSVSRPEAVQFAGGFATGVLLRADVPVSSIVGLSSSGFGCIIEGEVIVNGGSFTATVAEQNPKPRIEMKVGEPKPAGGNWLQKAIPTINLDSTDTNQDWPKRTPDTYAALGLPSPISKFNPYHDAAGRFSSADQAVSGWGANDWRNKLPAPPGTTPVPEGALRLWHYTSDSALDSIEQTGLQMASARGESYGEPDLIWGSAQTPDFSDIDTRPRIEFYVLPEEVDIGRPNVGESGKAWADRLTRAKAHVTTTTDIEPSRIIIHHKWHRATRYMEREILAEVLAGEHDNLVGDKNYAHYGKAIEYLKTKHEVSKFNPYHDELGRFTSASGATGATSYTGGTGRHEGTIEVTDYNGEPRLLMPITSYVEEGTELPDGRITEGGYHIDEQEARGLASEIFDVELELEDADGKPIKVRASLLSPYHSRVGATVKDDNTQYARIKFAGSLMLKEEGVEEYPVGEFNGEIDPFGESAYIAGDVFGAPSGPGGATVKDGKPLASIDGLYINVRDLQGLGVGTALMAHWEDQLARTGVDRIVIEAVSNSGGLTGGYSWMKYGYTPARGAVDSVLRQFVDEKVESDWELPSSKSIGNLAAMLGLPSHTANPEYYSPLQRLEQIQSHMPWGKQWEAITESGTTNENFGSYEWRHGQDWTPVLEAVPEFKDFALAEARWYGSKKLETIEKAATPALSPQIEATIRVANRWMRENPAGLENDDDAFWAEVAEARASAPVSKFNPYHDELGRFTSANAAATISGGALGANRELTISMAEAALGELTDSQKTMLREAAAGDIDFAGVADDAFVGIGVKAYGSEVQVNIKRADRGKLKEQGARTVANAMSLDEMEACVRAMVAEHGEFGQGIYNRNQGVTEGNAAEKFIATQHNQWAATAGGNAEALAIQVAAAEMQGWDDQQITDRVFRETPEDVVAAGREIAKQVIANAGDNTAELLHDDIARAAIRGVVKGGTLDPYLSVAVAGPIIGAPPRAIGIVTAQAFIRSELLGDAHKAVLAANQRVSQRLLKESVGDAPTITLFRGVQVTTEGLFGDDFYGGGEQVVTGGKIRSKSSPLSSWSVSRPEAVAFAGGFSEGVLLRADVPVSSIVGLSSVGFGCVVEGEVIVSGASFTATVAEQNPPPVIEMKIGEPVPLGGVKKAIPTINLDSTDINQDWPKRTPDTYAALGLPSPISKFNPYHDERGRFTSANTAVTMSGGALGANRELTISIMERALGRSLTGPERTTIRETDLRRLYVVETRQDPDLVAQRLDPHPKLGQAMNLVVRQEVRVDTKERGAKTIADEMTPDERAACEAALLHGWPDRDLTVEQLVGQQHNLWAETAGDHWPEALAVQVSAAEMQGWDNQKIADRVFRETSRADVAVARELAKRVIEDGPVTEVILGDWGWLERSKAIEAAAVAMAHPDGLPRAAVQVAAQTFIHSELMGDAHKAVLAANQRVAQRELKAAVGDSPTITLFRGVQVSVDPAVTWGGVPVEEFTYPDIAREGAREERGQTVRSQSSPLSSWSVSYDESSKFSGDHGVVLQAEVPVSSLVGLSSVGFGCLSEGEVIVSGASFTADGDAHPSRGISHWRAIPGGEGNPHHQLGCNRRQPRLAQAHTRYLRSTGIALSDQQVQSLP